MSLYKRNYRTRKFSDIYSNEIDFVDDVMNAKIPCRIKRESVSTLFYLLYAYYGNSNIASSDETRFKYNMFSIIYQYGLTWETRLEIQTKMCGLTDEELVRGTKQINNHSYNPSTAPNTASLEELETINEQSTSTFKKSKLDAYTALNEYLEKDVCKEFLDKFRKLFLVVATPEEPLWYETPIDDDIIEG